MWRLATESDCNAIVSMCMALNADDPGPAPVQPEDVTRTLITLWREPYRGRAVVCDINGHAVAYALLIPFWSNELGGEVCTVDELYVGPEYRGRGLATRLFERLVDEEQSLWSGTPVALALEVTPQNERARALYEHLGFRGKNIAMRRPLSNVK